jgi:hypothetical protein
MEWTTGQCGATPHGMDYRAVWGNTPWNGLQGSVGQQGRGKPLFVPGEEKDLTSRKPITNRFLRLAWTKQNKATSATTSATTSARRAKGVLSGCLVGALGFLGRGHTPNLSPRARCSQASTHDQRRCSPAPTRPASVWPSTSTTGVSVAEHQHEGKFHTAPRARAPPPYPHQPNAHLS